MAVLLTAELASTTGLPEDSVVNTFAFTQGPGATAGERTQLMAQIIAFYNGVGTGQQNPVAYYLGRSLDRNNGACRIRYYDLEGHLSGSPHGSPIDEVSFTLGPSAAVQGLPTEVAAVLRLEAVGRAEAPNDSPDGPDPDFLPDRPKQRLTGRLYLGPLNLNCVTSDTPPGQVRIAGSPSGTPPGFRGDVLVAAQTLADYDQDVAASPLVPMEWGVWSRKNSQIVKLERVSMDDAFDTQRRRGVAPLTNIGISIPA